MGALYQNIIEESEHISMKRKKKETQEKINQQVVKLFKFLEETKAYHSPETVLQSVNHERIRNYYKVEKEYLGFGLTVEPSTIPNSGHGVMLHGNAMRGTVLAIYPGVVYLPYHLSKNENYLKEVIDNPYARGRFDHVIIDAKKEARVPKDNPFGVGHMINHPTGQGKKPNVICWAYDFPDDSYFQSTMIRHVPHVYAEEPPSLFFSLSPMTTPSIVLIAANDIEDEELFLNYRYNPYSELPDWYTPVDFEKDKQMWSTENEDEN